MSNADASRSDGRRRQIARIATLAACLFGNAVGLHTLTPYTIGLFVDPLSHEFGWGRTSISFGVTILTTITAVVAPVAGRLADRIGERRPIAFSMIVLAGAYFALSRIGNSILEFWSIMALMAFLGVGCTSVTLSRIMVANFDENRGTALGISLIGTALPAIVGPLLLGPIIAADGWRSGFVVLAGTMIAFLPIILGLLLFSGAGGSVPRPKTTDRGPSGRVRGLLHDPVFRMLLLAVVMVALATGGVVVHFVPILIEAGYSSVSAARLATSLGVSLIVGRLIIGFLMDRIFAPYLAAALFLVGAAGFFVVWLSFRSMALLCGPLIGTSLGAEVDLIPFLVSVYFPATSFGRTYGPLYAVFLLGVAVSPLLYGACRDLAGSYDLAFAFSSALLLASVVFFLRMPAYREAEF